MGKYGRFLFQCQRFYASFLVVCFPLRCVDFCKAIEVDEREGQDSVSFIRAGFFHFYHKPLLYSYDVELKGAQDEAKILCMLVSAYRHDSGAFSQWRCDAIC